MMLQSEAVQIGSGVLSLATFGMVLRLTFSAGRAFQKFVTLEGRVRKLEHTQCPHPECPVRAHFGLEDAKAE